MANEHQTIIPLAPPSYRGRLAPSPTGFLHLGHARTFSIAYQRARTAGGALIFRSDDLDRSRVRPQFEQAMVEDIRWLGLNWDEGPDIGGPFAPYQQSARLEWHRSVLTQLQARELVYPCNCSRQDVLRALNAPHGADEEPIYPGTCRHKTVKDAAGNGVSWRFRTAENTTITFQDATFGTQSFASGHHFGDFVVWRPDDLPAYQLACVADDSGMRITEVGRGADLLLSTARQLLLYRSLDLAAPKFCHCPLVTDPLGVRLAKRHDALSLRELRRSGKSPQEVLSHFEAGLLAFPEP